MARILITSGATRQYLDPVRYLTNASSGRMGRALAAAAIAAGHEVLIVSGPVDVDYPSRAELISVVSTEEMLDACLKVFGGCDGLIGVAAPCDYRPVKVALRKMKRTGQPLLLELIETPDVVAGLGAVKTHQWLVAFALETEDKRMRALQKLERKRCDLVVLNSPDAIHGPTTHAEVIDPSGTLLATLAGPKDDVAVEIFRIIDQRLIGRRPPHIRTNGALTA